MVFFCRAALGLIALACLFGRMAGFAEEPRDEAIRKNGVEQRMTLRAHVSPREQRAIAALRAGAEEPIDGVVRLDRADYVVRNVEFTDAESCAAFDVPGATVFNRFDRFADVFVLDDLRGYDATLEAMRGAKGYVWDEFSGRVISPPPPVGKRTTTRATPDAIVRGGVQGLAGKGTIYVVLDTGLDFYNPDFVTYDDDGTPTSRLRWYWDTVQAWDEGSFGAHGPLSYPNGASLGTLYSRDDLNKALRAARPLFNVWDIDGHGTACAGIAVGNGNNSDGRYVGVAPQADIIAVRLGDHYEQGYLLGAICDWVDKLAGDTPVVISCSYGSTDGGHDGKRIEERQLDARFPLSVKGRAICIAAGNEGNKRDHAEVSFGARDDAAKLSWSLQSSGYLAVYYDTDDPDDLAFVDTGDAYVRESGNINKVTGDYVGYFDFSNGDGAVELYTRSGKTLSANAYLFSNSRGLDGGFERSIATYHKKISTPGAAANAITVGSYDWNDQFEQFGIPVSRSDPVTGNALVIGALSGYSSAGPLRDSDVVKPDIVAPGQYFAASAARNTPGELDTTGWYGLFNGTSAATPYTAGVVLLLMEKKPSITLGEIKQLLKECATQDRNTGRLPNPEWGNGKLSVPAVKRMLKRLE
jgi:subtilisin family serine protease